MAKKMKAKDATTSKRISREDYKKAVESVAHARDNAKEYAGVAGQTAKTFVERHNLNRKAFNFAAGLANMETAKRDDVVRSLLYYLDCGGCFDSMDMFDPVADDLEAILEKIRGKDTSGGVSDAATTSALAGSPLPN